MKKNIKFIGIVIVAALVGFAAMFVAIAFDASDKVAIAAYFIVTTVVAVAMGALRESKDTARHTSIKDAARYGQAAIFVGTACLFIGTPQECEELADSLQHHAQPVRVDSLTGEETFDIL